MIPEGVTKKLQEIVDRCKLDLLQRLDYSEIKFWISDDIRIDAYKHVKMLVDVMHGVNCINYDKEVKVIIVPNNIDWGIKPPTTQFMPTEPISANYMLGANYLCVRSRARLKDLQSNAVCSPQRFQKILDIVLKHNPSFLTIAEFEKITETKKIEQIAWHIERGLPSKYANRPSIFVVSPLNKSNKEIFTEVITLQ